MTFACQRDAGKNMYATPFVLKPETSNKYKVNSLVTKAVSMHDSIPFLRDTRDTSNKSFKKLKQLSAFNFGQAIQYNEIVLGRKTVKEVKR